MNFDQKFDWTMCLWYGWYW